MGMKPHRRIRLQDVPKRQQNLHRAIAEGAPEMLEDADFALRKATRQPRAKPEALKQRAVVVYLRKHLPLGSIVFAITNHSRSKHQTFALIAQGMLPGMPDVGVLVPSHPLSRPMPQQYHLYSPHRHCLFFIEMKSDTGKLSEAQRNTQELLRDLGVPVLSECRSVDEAKIFLQKLGVQFR